MSLRVKIQEQAKTLAQLNRTCKYLELSRFCRDCLGDCEFVGTSTFLGRFVSVDVVSGLLDKAIEEINQIMCEDYWTCNVHLNKVREKILGVLSGEKKVEG